MTYLILILAVLFGFALVSVFRLKTKFIQIFLSFSGAYLLSITVLHLIPEVFKSSYENIGLFILLGIVLQTILEFFSKGAEHGHIHTHDFAKNIPWLLFVSLSLHAFLEGLPLGLYQNPELLWAVVVHKIPITIVLIVFLQKSNLSNSLIYFFVISFSLMSPLGKLLSGSLPLLSSYHIQINAIIIGIFLHISTAILFESSENHQFNYKKFIAILSGFIIAIITL